MSMIDINEIKNLIPHRYPFLFVDRVIQYHANESIVAIKNVSINESYFVGHFPSRPIMPGVLIVEAMAQAAGILVNKSLNLLSCDNEIFFMAIENAKFRQIVEPGDCLYVEVAIKQNRGNVWKFTGKARVNDKVVAEAEFTAMVKKKESLNDK